MIHCVNLNATVDAFYHLDSLGLDGVNRAVQVDRYHGGKGANVARVIARLGGPSRLVAFGGRVDHREAAAFFRLEGVTPQLVPVPGEARLCMILWDKKKNEETVVNSPTAIRPRASDLKALEKRLVAAVKPGDLVTFSGSAPEGISPRCFAQLSRAAQRAGARVMQDCYGPGLKYGVEAKPYLVKINEHELRSSFGFKAPGQAGLLKAMGKLLGMGVNTVVVTLGSKGALVRAGDGAWRVAPLSPKKKVTSPVGSGDAFMAGLAWGLDRGLLFADSLRLATAAAWDNLHQPGACFIDAQQTAKAMGRVKVVKVTVR